MDQDGVKVHKHAKKEQGQNLAILTEKAWLIKDLLYGTKNKLFLWNIHCTAHSQVVKMAPSCLLGWASHTVSFNHVINKKAKEINSVQGLGMNEILSRHA